MTDIFQIRPYEAGDYATIEAWWDERGKEAWPESLVPDDGMVVLMDGMPVCSGWLFLVERSHLAFFHGLVTRPGLTRKQAQQAVMHLCEGLDIIMRAAGRTLMIGSVESSLVRFAGQFGFKVNGDELQPVFKLVTPD